MIGGRRTRKKMFGLNVSTSVQSRLLYDSNSPTKAPKITIARLSGTKYNLVVISTCTTKVAAIITKRMKNMASELLFSCAASPCSSTGSIGNFVVSLLAKSLVNNASYSDFK